MSDLHLQIIGRLQQELAEVARDKDILATEIERLERELDEARAVAIELHECMGDGVVAHDRRVRRYHWLEKPTIAREQRIGQGEEP